MNSKGQSLVDFEPAEPASTRRSLLGVAGLASLVGASVAVLSGQSAAAAPDRPSDADRAALTEALRLELAATDLYRLAAAELTDDAETVATVMADQHRAYAEAISGMIGLSSPGPNEDVVDELTDAFTTSDAQAFGNAASSLENTAVATHTELLGGYDSIQAVNLTASIITVESRHAAVLTSLAGFSSNLDEMLGNTAEALDISGGAA
jgi:rubrerythrin